MQPFFNLLLTVPLHDASGRVVAHLGYQVDVTGLMSRAPNLARLLADELDSWGIGRWSPLGEKELDCPINWKLAVDTFSENYHFATVHRQTFATIARSNCTVFDSYGPHHRLIFPLNTILELGFRTSIEKEWRWRVSRGESTANLAAFTHLRPADLPSD